MSSLSWAFLRFSWSFLAVCDCAGETVDPGFSRPECKPQRWNKSQTQGLLAERPLHILESFLPPFLSWVGASSDDVTSHNKLTHSNPRAACQSLCPQEFVHNSCGQLLPPRHTCSCPSAPLPLPCKLLLAPGHQGNGGLAREPTHPLHSFSSVAPLGHSQVNLTPQASQRFLIL